MPAYECPHCGRSPYRGIGVLVVHYHRHGVGDLPEDLSEYIVDA